jgi:SAM-dependent methyltransferase
MSIVAGIVVALVLVVAWQRRHPSPYPPRIAFLLDIPVPGLRANPSRRADASALPFRDRSVDRILLVSVLGEVPARDRALRECSRLLPDDGALIVAESVIDPDYIAPRTLTREARDAGLISGDRHGSWMSYTQALWHRSSRTP